MYMMLSCWHHGAQDLQCALGWFAAGMRISTCKSEVLVLDRKEVVYPLLVAQKMDGWLQSFY